MSRRGKHDRHAGFSRGDPQRRDYWQAQAGRIHRVVGARLFERLLAGHVDPKSGEQWGNFVQTYSMVGLINSAIRLSVRRDQAF